MGYVEGEQAACWDRPRRPGSIAAGFHPRGTPWWSEHIALAS